MKNFIEAENQMEEFSSSYLENISGKGELSITGNLTISGIYSGKLVVSECLEVAKDGILIGEFYVKDLVVFGKIIGTIHVSNVAKLHEGSQISGTLAAKEIRKHYDTSLHGEHSIENFPGDPAIVLKTGT